MNDDWRLQIDLDDAGIAGKLADHLRAGELENELKTDFNEAMIVSHEGERTFVYAGTREPLDWVRKVVEEFVASEGWTAELELRHWHPAAEDWEDPDTQEPATDEEKQAERARLMKTEDEEVAANHGYAEFEVRVEFPSHHEATELAQQLKDEGFEPVRRWRYLVVGAADEDQAKELAERIRGEAPADSKVTVEGSAWAARNQRPPNPSSGSAASPTTSPAPPPRGARGACARTRRPLPARGRAGGR